MKREDRRSRWKYLVTAVGESRMACGLRWDHRKEVLVIGGPRGSRAAIEIMVAYFGGFGQLLHPVDWNGVRVRAEMKVSRRKMVKSLEELKEDRAFQVEEVKGFRRLMS